MSTGIIKWFNEKKGYGFIVQDSGDEDVFVHYTGIVGEGYRSLTTEQRVEYEVVAGKKGNQAVNVRPT